MKVRTTNDMVLFTKILLEYAELLKTMRDYTERAKKSTLNLSVEEDPICVDHRAIVDVVFEMLEVSVAKFETSVVQFLGEPKREGEKSLAYFVRIANVANQDIKTLARYMGERGLNLQVSIPK